MGRKKEALVIAIRCSKCKLKTRDLCGGAYVINVEDKKKLPTLEYCPSFLDTRKSDIIKKDIFIPHPIKK